MHFEDIFINMSVDPRQSPLARAIWIVNASVDQIGTVLFSCLIIATIKQKRLHNPCQILVGIYAFCSLLTKLQILLPFFVFILPGSGKIPRIVCALVQILPIGGCQNVFTLMFVIGIDRMLGMYSFKNGKKYLIILYSLSLSFPLVFLAYVIRSLIQNPFLQVQCFSQDILGVDGRSIILSAQLVFNFLTLGCYVIMFFKLVYDHKTGKMCSIRKSIYVSLAIIMGIQIFGYMFSLTAFNLLNLIYSNFTDEQSQIIKCIINIASSLSSSAEVPAMFIVSSEHRLAMKEEFSWFFRHFSSDKNTSKIFTLTNKML
ncbi:hypothetical protein Mgra_00004572 [Meloidogyne graminicola]|uniref:G_PROTEIN_RECEP_F1_2 domain-containing protein n=1 Tax=Meloidogyne graminicola TaxID=189291 RepID=A0A8S9ZRW9_9BILA|nr:hypothetical protein Mgra_00004572 [Meloidogyne graminicola]